MEGTVTQLHLPRLLDDLSTLDERLRPDPTRAAASEPRFTVAEAAELFALATLSAALRFGTGQLAADIPYSERAAAEHQLAEDLMTEVRKHMHLLVGIQPGRQTADAASAVAARIAQRQQQEPAQEALSDSELRVLRYLPTNLTVPEIAAELYVSPHTVKTHIRHVYAKLGAHRRTEAVTRARSLGLLGSSAMTPAE